MALDFHEKPANAEPAVSELLEMFQAMRNEFSAQRTEFERKITALESELFHVRNQKSVPAVIVNESTPQTSRRRMLKKLVAGAAGAAMLGAGASSVVPTALAGSLDFNGSGTGATGNNIASGITKITSDSNVSTTFPVLEVNNIATTPGNPSADPESQSIGIYATSSSNFAIYGATTGAGNAPTGIIGISGNKTLLANSFFANEVGGVVGASDTNPGTVGLSGGASAGVEGLSGTGPGVKGISQSGVGAAFGSAGVVGTTPSTTQGAPIRIGIRTGAASAPAGKTSPHDAGELFIDQISRMYICQVGYQPSATNKPTATTQPGLPQGLTDTNGSSWRLLTPMAIKNARPTTPFTNDQGLHVQGEIWLDISTGITYSCVTTGSNNPSILQNTTVPNVPPVFKPTGGNVFQLLSFADRFIDTRPAPGQNRGGIVGPIATGLFPSGATYTFQLGGVTGRGGQTIPAGVSGVFGNVTISSPVFDNPAGQGSIKFVAGDITDTSTGTGVVPFPSTSSTSVTTSFSNSFTSRLDSTGKIKIALVHFAGVNSGSANVLIDIVGYYL